MMSLKRLWEIALYGFGEYPRVDIDSGAAVDLQRANITEFKRRWRNWLLGLAGAVSAFIWPLAMNHWVDPTWDKTHAGYYVSLFFFSVIVTIICGFKYKCPHCGAVPQGVLFSASEGTVTYGGGLHPFPIRCRKCGYYLAGRALRRDLKAGGMHG
ncbi:MAG: hypothetical protein U1E04_03120 [Hylemonella sp.]|jgi:phage FluMu protein Com|nr:hypothetical protein [Hylemonella sp.]